jgi:hypothetical protein
MTHGGQKGFGMTKHGRSGHATRSPRFRFLQKLEAQKNDRKDRSRIKDPKQCVEELFCPRKAALAAIDLLGNDVQEWCDCG